MQRQLKLEAKDVLPNTNRTQPTKRAEKCLLSQLTLTFDLWSERGTKHVFRLNLAQIRSAVPRYFIHKQKTLTDGAKKQNLSQFTACGNYSP